MQRLLSGQQLGAYINLASDQQLHKILCPHFGQKSSVHCGTSNESEALMSIPQSSRIFATAVSSCSKAKCSTELWCRSFRSTSAPHASNSLQFSGTLLRTANISGVILCSAFWESMEASRSSRSSIRPGVNDRAAV